MTAEPTNPIDSEYAVRWGGEAALVDLYDVEGSIVGRIPLDRLSEFQPLEISPWSDAPAISRRDVEMALLAGDLNDEPYSLGDGSLRHDWTTRDHAARIAYLVVNPSDDPIEIEFTEAGEPWMVLTDGRHRLAAAQISKRPDIVVSVSGFIDHVVAGLGAICRTFQVLEDDDWEGEASDMARGCFPPVLVS